MVATVQVAFEIVTNQKTRAVIIKFSGGRSLHTMYDISSLAGQKFARETIIYGGVDFFNSL